jgi:hypothetical protein
MSDPVIRPLGKKLNMSSMLRNFNKRMIIMSIPYVCKYVIKYSIATGQKPNDF